MQLRHDHQQKILFFDLETESLNTCRTRPWQASWQVYQGKKLVDSQDRFPLWKDLNVSAKAAELTGFNKQIYLSKAEDNRRVFDDLIKLILDPEYLLVGHNILGFDVMVLQTWGKILGVDLGYEFFTRCIDTLCLEKAIRANIELSRETLFEDQLKLCFVNSRGMSLGVLGKKYEIDFDPKKLHDSLEDIKLNNAVFRKQLWKIQGI